MSIKDFNEWSSINEGVTSEQAEKVFAEAEKWKQSSGIEVEINSEGLKNGWGSTYIWVREIFGLWKLELEKSTKKGGQDSMYRETYQRGDDKKWYISYPGRWSQYDSRGRTKPGNLKTFKTLVEEFIEVKKVFDKISFFFENALGIKGIDTTHHESREKLVVTVAGKDLKNLSAYCGSISYNREKKWGEIDPIKVEILLAALSSKDGGGFKFKKPVEETGKNFEEILEILEIIKDQPLDNFLEETKHGDWKVIRKKYAGRISGNRYGL